MGVKEPFRALESGISLVDNITYEFRSSIEALEIELRRIIKAKEWKLNRLARLLLQPSEEVRKKIK